MASTGASQVAHRIKPDLGFGGLIGSADLSARRTFGRPKVRFNPYPTIFLAEKTARLPAGRSASRKSGLFLPPCGPCGPHIMSSMGSMGSKTKEEEEEEMRPIIANAQHPHGANNPDLESLQNGKILLVLLKLGENAL